MVAVFCGGRDARQAERHCKSWGQRVSSVRYLQDTLEWLGPMVGLVLRHQHGRVALRQPAFFAFSHSKCAPQNCLHQRAVSGVLPCPLQGECAHLMPWPAACSSLFPLGKGHRRAWQESYAWRESPYPCLFKVAITLWGEQIFCRMVTSGDIAVQINRAKGCWNYALQFKLLLGLFWRMHLW